LLDGGNGLARAAAALKAFSASVLAAAATALALLVFPVTTPGENPVMAVPGLTPRSPFMTEGPVFVTVVAPRTQNDAAVPTLTACALIRTWPTRLQAKRKWLHMMIPFVS
jgi:hypothetical protein